MCYDQLHKSDTINHVRYSHAIPYSAIYDIGYAPSGIKIVSHEKLNEGFKKSSINLIKENLRYIKRVNVSPGF
eukprot:gene5937-15951_t